MIRISREMMMNPKGRRREPPDDLLDGEVSGIRKLFTETYGWKATPLAEKVLPIIARRSIDLCGATSDGWDDAHKGVAMLGSVGTGKTILLNYAALLIDVTVFNVPELSRIHTTAGAEAFWNRVMDRTYIKKDMMLDDLGAESDAKRFGVPFPIVDLIYRRYDTWRSHGVRLWISSNLTGEELINRYGARVHDRLKEMCVVVPAMGESMRK